jgi:hypothetical protein
MHVRIPGITTLFLKEDLSMKRLGYCFLAVLLSLAPAGVAFAQLPPPPVNLTAKATAQFPVGIDLEWQLAKILPPVMPGAFKVYRSVDDSVSFKLLNVTEKTGYNDRQVVPGHTYFYYVTWVWIMPDSTSRESGKSNIAWVQLGPAGGEKTGKIAGTVTDSVSGKAIPNSRVMFFRPASPILWIPQTWADSLGRYSAVLDTGTYLVQCDPPFLVGRLVMTPVAFPVYKPKWYKDAYDPGHATPVKVTDGATDTIDFALARFVFPTLVHVKGTVRDSAGNPLKGALVAITRTVQEMHEMSSAGEAVTDLPGETLVVDNLGCIQGVAWKGLTDSTGAYDAMVLSQRSYVALAAKGGYFPQYYDHKNTPSEATIIALNGGVSGIDFNLNPYHPPHMYSISGVVADSAGIRVPSRIIVFPLRLYANRPARFGFTDSLGEYSVDHLLAGKYIVLAVPFGKYAPAFYKAGAFGVIRWKNADTVTVAANVSGITIGVVQIHSSGVATLTGRITSGGQPLEGVNVVAQDAGGAALGYGVTDGAGSYAMDALPAGPVTLTVDLMGYNGAEQMINVGASQFALSQDFSLGITTSVSGSQAVPQAYALGQNYPNPFNPSTRISFSLPQTGAVTLKVFNLLGQELTTLVNGPMTAGTHETLWDGRDAAGRVLASGVYFYRIEVKGPDGGAAYSAMRKMVLLK